MKTGIVLLIAYILLISTGCSQTKKIERGYAYAGNIIAGVKPKVILKEDGSITTKRKEPGIEYFIYIETKDTSSLPVKNIWIRGNEYFAKAEAVKNLPVIIANDSYTSENNDTLVAAGKFIVWKINVGQLIPPSDNHFTKPKNPDSQGVLIGLLYKGIVHYYSISKIKYLEPLRLQ